MSCWNSSEEHAAVKAIRFLRTEHRVDDIIVVPRAAELNQTQYICRQLGLENPRIIWPRTAFSAQGHTVHIASLRYDEVWWQSGDKQPPPSDRVWILAADARFAVWPPQEIRPSRQWTFSGGQGSTITLQLLERAVVEKTGS